MTDHPHDHDLEVYGICRTCADRAILGSDPETAQLTLDDLDPVDA